MGEKVTTMILKVDDLQRPSCYKKIKKILCKFPQIRDQMYDEKNNLVKITVVCCSPEKIRDKLCCKGGKVIKSIEIVVPPPPKPKDPEKPDKQPKPGPQPCPAQPACLIPVGYICVPCSAGYGGGPCHCGYGRPVPPPPCYDHYCYWYRWYGSRCDCFSDENASACTIL